MAWYSSKNISAAQKLSTKIIYDVEQVFRELAKKFRYEEIAEVTLFLITVGLYVRHGNILAR